jgi:hypothetical protein
MIHGQNINLNPSFVAQRRNSLKFKPQGPEAEMTFHYYWRVKSVVLNWFEWNLYLPMQLTDWQLVQVALLLIGLIQISSTKICFNLPRILSCGAGPRGLPIPFSASIIDQIKHHKPKYVRGPVVLYI